MLGAIKIRGPGIQDVFNLVREIRLLFSNQLENNQELNYENDERRENRREGMGRETFREKMRPAFNAEK